MNYFFILKLYSELEVKMSKTALKIENKAEYHANNNCKKTSAFLEPPHILQDQEKY